MWKWLTQMNKENILKIIISLNDFVVTASKPLFITPSRFKISVRNVSNILSKTSQKTSALNALGTTDAWVMAIWQNNDRNVEMNVRRKNRNRCNYNPRDNYTGFVLLISIDFFVCSSIHSNFGQQSKLCLPFFPCVKLENKTTKYIESDNYRISESKNRMK